MAGGINKLSARAVATIKDPGRHGDGGGLYLVVDYKTGTKRWTVLYTINGKRREIGLGSLNAVSLARARELAADVRAKVADGVDPLAEASTPQKEAPPTFGAVADRFMADRETEWRNPKHRAQWRTTLEVGAASIWSMPVGDVDTAAVLAVLRPIWATKPETARRTRGRMESVLDAARATGHRTGENPARWRGHLDAILPRSKKLTRGHHAALPYPQIPAFMIDLAGRKGQSSRALELLILTAARSGEVRGMAWDEVNLGDALWTVPGERMKSGRTHRVPLSAPALDILRRLHPDRASDLVFPGVRGQVQSDMVFEALFRRIRRTKPDFPDITAHGFRSTFRDWAADETHHQREVIEAALAHQVGDDTERAYRRSDALEKRRALMDHWAAFTSTGGKPLV